MASAARFFKKMVELMKNQISQRASRIRAAMPVAGKSGRKREGWGDGGAVFSSIASSVLDDSLNSSRVVWVEMSGFSEYLAARYSDCATF